jgi:hypothetical protein
VTILENHLNHNPKTKLIYIDILFRYRHAPLRLQRIRHSAIPWLNSNIKKKMRNRDCHKKQSVKHGSEYPWKLYQASRDRVNIKIRKQF